MTERIDNKDDINIEEIYKTLKAKRKTFFIIWGVVFVLSCLWIFPQPRYYACDVSLAPEAGGENVGGGLAGIASDFGINLGGASNDAIYPMLYPELMESNDFVCDLFTIKVRTEDGSVNTDYYTYLKKYQKKNWLTQPFLDAKKSIKNMFVEKKSDGMTNPKELDPFMLSESDFDITENVKKKITCSVDKKTDVITISVKDQDRVICATLADSVRERLQKHIIDYRTKKIRMDVEHYQQLADSANLEYRFAVNRYAEFCDANQEVFLQRMQSKRDELENEMQMSYNTYQAMKTQLEAVKAKLQERTPVFTTLKTATVPIKPAGPKRMLFVIGMMFFVTIIASFWFARKEIFNTK